MRNGLAWVLGALVMLGSTSAARFAEAAPPYSAKAPEKLSPGNYILRLRLTTINSQPASAKLIRGVPIVVAIKGATIGLGGRLGPQVTGSTNGASMTVNGKVGHGPMLQMTGGTSGRWTMSDASGSIGGEYALDPFVDGAPLNTMAGVGTTSGFSNMGTFGSSYNGIPGSGPLSGGPTVGGNVKGGAKGGTTGNQPGQLAGFGGGPERANLGTSSVSGANAGLGDDFLNWLGLGGSGSSGSDSSPMTPINKPGGSKDPGGTGGTSGSSGTTGGGKQLSNFGDQKPGGGNSGSSGGGIVEGAKAAYNCITTLGGNCTAGSGNAGSNGTGSTKGGGKQGGDTRDTSGNGPGTDLNTGRVPGGGDTGDTGVSGGGSGVLHLPVGGGGDNPFELSPGDVLNANKLVDGAKGPTGATGGPAMVH